MDFMHFNFKLAVIAWLNINNKLDIPEFETVEDLLKYCEDIELTQHQLDKIDNFTIHDAMPIYDFVKRNSKLIQKLYISNIDDIPKLRRLTWVNLNWMVNKHTLNLQPLLQLDNLMSAFVAKDYYADTEQNRETIGALKKQVEFKDGTEEDAVQNQERLSLLKNVRPDISSGNAKALLPAYKKLGEIYPVNAAIMYNTGRCLEELKEYRQALDWYRQCISRLGDLGDKLRRLLFQRCYVLPGYYLEQTDEAITAAHEALRESPGDFAPLHDIACFYFFKGDMPKALEYLEKSLESGGKEAMQRAVDEIDFKGIAPIEDFLNNYGKDHKIESAFDDFSLVQEARYTGIGAIPGSYSIWTNKLLLLANNKLCCLDWYALNEHFTVDLPGQVSFGSISSNQNLVFAAGFTKDCYHLSAYRCKNGSLQWSIQVSHKTEYQKPVWLVTSEKHLFVFIEKIVFKISAENGDITSKNELPHDVEEQPYISSENIFIKQAGALARVNQDLQHDIIIGPWCDYSAANGLLCTLNEKGEIALLDGQSLAVKTRFNSSDIKYAGSVTGIRGIPGKPDYCLVCLKDSKLAALLNIRTSQAEWILSYDKRFNHNLEYRFDDIIASENGFILRLFCPDTDDMLDLFLNYHGPMAGFNFGKGFRKFVAAGDRLIEMNGQSLNLFKIVEDGAFPVAYLYPEFVESLQLIDRIKAELPDLLSDELANWKDSFKGELCAFGIDLHPWDALMELCFLSAGSQELKTYIGDWDMFQFTHPDRNTRTGWHEKSASLREAIFNVHEKISDCAGRESDLYRLFKTVGAAMNHEKVKKALQHFKLSDDFELILKNPDDPEGYNYCCDKERHEFLFDRIISKGPVNRKGSYGKTALMNAAENGDYDLVTLLIENGANPYIANDGGMDSFMYAEDKPEIIELLFEYRAAADSGDNFILRLLTDNTEIKGPAIDSARYNENTFFLYNGLLLYLDSDATELLRVYLPAHINFDKVVTNGSRVYISGYGDDKYHVYCCETLNGDVVWEKTIPVVTDRRYYTKAVAADDALFFFAGNNALKIDVGTGEIIKHVRLDELSVKDAGYIDGRVIVFGDEKLAALSIELDYSEISGHAVSFDIGNGRIYFNTASDMYVLNCGDLSEIFRVNFADAGITEDVYGVYAIPNKPDSCLLRYESDKLVSLFDIKDQQNIWTLQSTAEYMHENAYHAYHVGAGEYGFALYLYSEAIDHEINTFVSYAEGLSGSNIYKLHLHLSMPGQRLLDAGKQGIRLYAIVPGNGMLTRYFYPVYSQLTEEQRMFDGVDFGDDIETIAHNQLETGGYAQKDGSGPGDWFQRAMESSLAPQIKHQLRDSLNNALGHKNPRISVEALSVLSTNANLRVGSIIIGLIKNCFWDKFAGLRLPDDVEDKDRGRDVLHLAAGQIYASEEAVEFIKQMAFDSRYGSSVLASLTYNEPEWVIDNIQGLVNTKNDPEGSRLAVILHNLKDNDEHVLSVFENLKGRGIDDILNTAKDQFKNSGLYDKITELLTGQITAVAEYSVNPLKGKLEDFSDIRKDCPFDLDSEIEDISRYFNEHDEEAYPLYLLGTNESYNGHYNVARQYLDSFIRMRPNDPRGYFERANNYSRMGEIELALADYQKCLEFDDYPEPKAYIGSCHYTLGEIEKALEWFNRALRDDESQIVKLGDSRADCLRELKRFEDAVDNYTLFIKHKPHFSRLYLERGKLLVWLQRFSEARNDFSHVIKIDTNREPNSNGLLWLGKTYVMQDDYEKAIEPLEEALKIYPNNIDVYWYLAMAYENTGREAEALTCDAKAKIAKQIRDLESELTSPNSYAFTYADTNLKLGELYLELEFPFKAQKHLNFCIHQKQGDAKAHVLRARSYGMMQKFDEAQADLDQALLINSDEAGVYLEKGRISFKNSWFDEAISHFSKAIELDSSLSSACLSRGLSYFRQNKLEAAIADFDRALEIDPDNLKARAVRGSLNTKNGNYQQAVEDITAAINGGVGKSDEYYDRAVSYNNLGENEKALKDYNIFLKKQPYEYFIVRERAELQLQMGRQKEAFDDYDYFLEGYPNDTPARIHYGKLLADAGLFEKAAVVLEKAFLGDVLPEDRITALISRGRAYLELKQYEKAIADFVNIKNLAPDNSENSEYLARCYREIGKTDEAEKAAAVNLLSDEKAAELAELSEKIRTKKALIGDYTKRGMIFFSLGKHEEAADDLYHAVTTDLSCYDPLYTNACKHLAECYQKLEKPDDAQFYIGRAGEVEAILDKLKKLNAKIEDAPDFAENYFQKGELLAGLSRGYDAGIAFTKYIEMVPESSEGYEMRAKAYLKDYMYDNALADINMADTLKPDKAQTLYTKTLILIKKKKYSDALDSINRVISLGMQSAEVFSKRADMHDELGDMDAAIDDYTKAVELDQHFASAHANRGVMYTKKQMYDEALSDFFRYTGLAGSNADIYENIAAVYAKKQDFGKAIEYYSLCLDYEKNNFLYLFKRGELYYKTGNFEPALKDMRQILEFKTDYAPVFNLIGLCLMAQEKYHDAADYFQKAVSLKYDYDEAKESWRICDEKISEI